MNTHEMIAILRISDDPQKLATADELERLLNENTRLTAEIARIADDYYADYEEDAPLALSEMREALTVLLARKTAVKDEGHG